MTSNNALPPEIAVALGYARPTERPVFAAILQFDRALGSAVGQASEMLVGQLRLAWWRDALMTNAEHMPRGNPILDELVRALGPALPQLVPLVDGWEALLVAQPLDEAALGAHTDGRISAWLATSRVIGPCDDLDAVANAARLWSLADLAANLSDPVERTRVVEFAMRYVRLPARLSASMRPLAVLAELARRAITQGGAPLMADRTAALVALRCGLFGR